MLHNDDIIILYGLIAMFIIQSDIAMYIAPGVHYQECAIHTIVE